MQTSRRTFIKTTGSLTIGFCLGGERFSSLAGAPAPSLSGAPIPPLPSQNEYATIDAWLEVLADGRIRVFTGKIELGQGISTAVAQVAAEELNMEMSQVEVTMAETGRTPNEGYTAGSNSIESSAMSIRRAAAAAREQLLELAGKKLNIPPTELQIQKGKISTKDSSHTATFADLLEGRQLTGEVPAQVKLKPKEAYTLVGKAIPRDDVDRIVKGDPVYVHDLRFPGMVHARVVRPPVYGAHLLHGEEVPGILKTVINGSFIGVIATSEYQAIQAQTLARSTAKWSNGPALPKVDADYLQSLPSNKEQVISKGAQTANPTLKTRYFKPYIMHGATGPSCAVALYDDATLHVWTHSQGVYPLRESLSKMLHISPDAIHVKGVPGSGCYGHNGADDVAADAALLAMAYPGKHIRVQWTREEENAWEPYGSAMVMEIAASLDKISGRITHWKHDLWSDTHGARPGGNADNLLPARYIEQPFLKKPSGFSGGAYRNAVPYYSIPNQQVTAHFFDGPLRTSSLRSLGAYANLFAIESFMDELAEKAGKDPFEFRLMHLEDDRAREVVERLRDLTRGQPVGMAFSRYENTKSYCAVAAQVVIGAGNAGHPDGAGHPAGAIPRVQKMWAVIDAGEVINLDGIKNTIEGGMVQSASWTLYEEVKFNEHGITSLNWNTYPVSRFPQAPEVEVVVIDRPTEKAVGAGEAAQGPAAAAIVNAIYRASGKRIRSLPVASQILSH
jgi:CO/xanthine dehydrogenase Mo-binding subunit